MGLAVGLVTLVPTTAGAATTVNVDAATGVDGAGCGAVGSPCKTITQGIANAAAGDTVQVAAGTYAEQVLINKAVTVDGAGQGQTIIDGANATNLTAAGQVRIDAPGDVRLSDLSVIRAGAINASASTSAFGITVKGVSASSATYTITDVTSTGRGLGGKDYNLYCDGSTATLVIEHSTFTNADYNPLLIERCAGAVTIRDNVIEKTAGTSASGALYAMANLGTQITSPQLVEGNTVTGSISYNVSFTPTSVGTYTDVTIRDNDVASGAGTGIALNDLANNATLGTFTGANVVGNRVTGSGGGDGIRVSGDVAGTRVEGNTVTGKANGVALVAAASGTPSGTTLLANRIVGNTTGVSSAATETVAAEDNWWGCNAGPAAAGCNPVTGAVDADPWLVLRTAAAPTAVGLNTPSAITTDLTTNSAGAPATGTFPDGGTVAFSTTLGTVSPTSAALAGRSAGTTFSSPTAGTAQVSSTFDGQTVSASVTVTGPPPPVGPVCKIVKITINLSLLHLPPLVICI